MRNLFIVLEGPDGAGTTKHCGLLAERLWRDNRGVQQTFEPTDGPVGSAIRADLHAHVSIDAAALQQRFCEDRAWHLQEIIEPALARGETVISDRYLDSTLTYGEALGLDPQMLLNMNKDFRQPDLLFYLLPPFNVLQERMARREATDDLEKTELQRKVHANYERLARENPAIIVIDSSGKLEDVAERIYRAVLNHA